MKQEFKDLRLRQLSSTLASFDGVKAQNRPRAGWLRAVREALGLSQEDIGKKLGKSKSHIMHFETSEAADSITLRSLRKVAAALDCELVYAIVPRVGTLASVADELARARITDDVQLAARTMALEDQATDNVKEVIETKIKRRRPS